MALTISSLWDQHFIKKSSIEPGFTYLGAAAKRALMKDWIKQTKGVRGYADATAGSNNQPFVIGKTHKVPVLVNDASYYSHSIAKGLFRRKKDTNLDDLAEYLYLCKSKDLRQEGVLTSMAPAAFPESLTTYIDGIVTHLPKVFKPGHAAFIRACVGGSIMNLCSFRSVAFSLAPVLRQNTPKEMVELFAKKVFSLAVRFNSYHTPGTAIFGDVREFVTTTDLTDFTVNFDPAWPFAKSRNAPTNPYHFYRRVGDILHQKVHEETPFWKNPDSPKAVAKEFSGWVASCFDQGAREVYVWNQDSNLPSKKRLRKTLNKSFEVTEVMTLVKNRIIGKATFEDYVFRCTPG